MEGACPLSPIPTRPVGAADAVFQDRVIETEEQTGGFADGEEVAVLAPALRTVAALRHAILPSLILLMERWSANSMANSISLRKTVTDIRASNQIMQTLLEMLVSSGTAYASTDTEKNLIVFLAHLDQTYQGTGMSSFYLNELPWKLDSLFQIRLIS
jgi:hypothetical protein